MPLLTSLTSAYTFETSGAGIGNDVSGNGHNLVKTGTVNQAAGKPLPGTNGSSWANDGSNYLSANHNKIASGHDITITFWANLSAFQVFSEFVCGYQDSGSQQYAIFLDHTSKQFKFIVNGGGGGGAEAGSSIEDGAGAISLSTWYFVECYYDHTTSKNSINRNNGTPATLAGTVTPFGATANFYIGASNGFGGGFPFSGVIDGLHVWDKLLSSNERSDLYAFGAGLEYPFPSGRRRASVLCR